MRGGVDSWEHKLANGWKMLPKTLRIWVNCSVKWRNKERKLLHSTDAVKNGMSILLLCVMTWCRAAGAAVAAHTLPRYKVPKSCLLKMNEVVCLIETKFWRAFWLCPFVEKVICLPSVSLWTSGKPAKVSLTSFPFKIELPSKRIDRNSTLDGISDADSLEKRKEKILRYWVILREITRWLFYAVHAGTTEKNLNHFFVLKSMLKCKLSIDL